jgi:hypothetical protein
MSASSDTRVRLLHSLGQSAEPTSVSSLKARITRLRHLLAQQLGCAHYEFVFDEFNDVHCRQCGKDFTD